MIVLFVSPVNRVSPQGRDRQTYNYIDPVTRQLVVGETMKKTRPDGVKVRTMFVPDFNTGKYLTGLDEMVDNPFYMQEGEGIPESVKSATKISKQRLFEIEEKLPEDYLHSRISNSMFTTSSKNWNTEVSSFISSFFIELFDRPNRFDDTTLRGKLAIQLLKNHPKIAADKQSANPAVHYYYISQENEDLEEATQKQDLVDAVTYAKVKLLQNTSDFRIYQVACLCTNKNMQPIVQGQANSTQIKVQLNHYLDSTSRNFKENAKTFLSVIDLLENKDKVNRLYIKYMMQQAINTKIFDLRDGYCFWQSKASVKNMYKHTDLLKLENLLLNEMLVFNPEETEVTNWYNELYKELATKNIRLD